MLPSIRHLPLLLTILCPALNCQELRLGLTPIQGVMDQQTPDAPYSRFVEAVRNGIKTPLSIDYMQSDRAVRLLKKGELDCIFPVMKGGSLNTETIFSAPVNGVALHLFALERKYQSLDQLNQQVIVHLRGYIFSREKSSAPEVSFFPASDHNLAIEMLKKQRASAYMAFFPDIRIRTNNLTVPPLQFDSSRPLIKSYDSFECTDTEMSKKFIKQANKVINSLSKTGELKVIMGDYYEPVPSSN